MKTDENVNAVEQKSPVYDDKDAGVRISSSDAEHGSGEVVAVETTKRGLKARHAQMIALGGTIGKIPEFFVEKDIDNIQVLACSWEVVELSIEVVHCSSSWHTYCSPFWSCSLSPLSPKLLHICLFLEVP